MAKGKNKKLGKKGRGRKSDKHTFQKKEWHKLISPTDMKNTSQIGWTCVSKTSGTRVSTDYLRGRVGEMTLADISNQNLEREMLNKKIKMLVEEVKDGSCYTSFYGYDLTRETINNIIKKRTSLIDIYADVRTKDNYIFRVFLTSVTRRPHDKLRINHFANSSTIRLLRKKTVQALQTEVKNMTTEELANGIVEGNFVRTLNKTMRKVIPKLLTLVRKVKMIRRGDADKKKFLKKAVQKTTTVQAAVEENPEAKNALAE